MNVITPIIFIYNYYLFIKILMFFYNSIKNLEIDHEYLSKSFRLKILIGYVSLYYLFNHPLPRIGMYITTLSYFSENIVEYLYYLYITITITIRLYI